jgi:hypothetical protein
MSEAVLQQLAKFTRAGLLAELDALEKRRRLVVAVLRSKVYADPPKRIRAAAGGSRGK